MEGLKGYGTYANNISTRSQLAVFLLCVLFGYLGAHRLYAGKIGSAIVMILLLILGIIAVRTEVILLAVAFLLVLIAWIIIDFFVILTGHFKDNTGKRIQKLLG